MKSNEPPTRKEFDEIIEKINARHKQIDIRFTKIEVDVKTIQIRLDKLKK